MAEQTTLDSLLEMGFDRNRVEKAVAHTGNQGIERAMDWLMEHEVDPDIDEPYVPPVGNVLGGSDPQLPSPAAQPTTQGADPDGGDQMIHDGDTKRPMIEEEKREQIKRLEELMRVKQEERRERERAEEVDREKQRRRQGQELLQVKQKLQEDEMKKMRVRDKIARDREERALKAQEPLAAVRVYIQMNGDAPEGQDFTLLSPYPRRLCWSLPRNKDLK
ncbi:unnamed protein product [Coregonus sp. 'balchen']|nr:unnamed protein product [Coregonus sp. 'balchen']